MAIRFNIGSGRQGARQTVVIATTSTSVASTAFSSGTHQIRISAPAQCFYVVDQAPTATASDALLPAAAIDYITVNSGQKIAFFSATTQTISVVEIS